MYVFSRAFISICSINFVKLLRLALLYDRQHMAFRGILVMQTVYSAPDKKG